jgi:hypothetical protein
MATSQDNSNDGVDSRVKYLQKSGTDSRESNSVSETPPSSESAASSMNIERFMEGLKEDRKIIYENIPPAPQVIQSIVHSNFFLQFRTK